MAASSDLLRILCIHGYRQNGQIFRERTGALRKILKKHAELVFISAPNLVKDTANDERGWWFSRPDNDYDAKEESQCSKGYEESVQVVQKAVEEQGPFDGVLGFSQGASMVTLLCALQEQKDYAFNFHFAIFVAGFRARSAGFNDLYSKQIVMPTLHVFGDTDQVIPKDMSVAVLEHYVNPVTLNHTGGHFVPCASAQKKVYLEFLQQMKEMKEKR